MLKNERFQIILDLLATKGTITVKEIITSLDVSDMTVRRDLSELDNLGKLKRIHGGAQSVSLYRNEELSHLEKKEIYIEEKEEAAKYASRFIQTNDTVFLGPGTTIELLAEHIEDTNLRIVTNSLPVFNIFQSKEKVYEIYLIGGGYRKRTGAFIGNIANDALKKFKIGKTFISVNGINDNSIMTANIDEGLTQKIVLDNSQEKYIVMDHNKFNKEDFYEFYSLQEITGIITDSNISEETEQKYGEYTIIYSNKEE